MNLSVPLATHLSGAPLPHMARGHPTGQGRYRTFLSLHNSIGQLWSRWKHRAVGSGYLFLKMHSKGLPQFWTHLRVASTKQHLSTGTQPLSLSNISAQAKENPVQSLPSLLESIISSLLSIVKPLPSLTTEPLTQNMNRIPTALQEKELFTGKRANHYF